MPLLSALVRRGRMPRACRRVNPTAARAHLAATLCVLLLMAGAMPANALEISPFIGQRYGGSFEDANTGSTFEVADATSYGVILDFDLDRDRQIEVYLSRQDTRLTTSGTFTGDPLFDLTVDYYHIGGVYMLEGEQVRPFVSGTLGLTRMDPKGADLTTENRFSIALGGGAKFFLSKNVGLRLDVRGIYTAMNADTAVFCSGGCVIKVRSTGFIQAELGAALMLRF
jgi:hypothetical protein